MRNWRRLERRATVGVETLEGVIRGLADGTFYGYAIVAVGPDKAFSSWATATNRTELLGLVNVVADRIVSNINDDTGDD